MSRRARTAGTVLLVLAAVGSVLWPRPSPALPSRLVVAERDLPAGHVLAPGDLAVLEVAGEGLPRPEEAEDLRADLLDSQLALSVRAGEPLTRSASSGGSVARELPEDLVAVSVRARDPASSELVRPGDRATLLTSTAAGEPVEAEAIVLRRAEVPADGGGSSGSGGGGPGWGGPVRGGGESPVLVGVAPEDARRLAAAEPSVSFALHR
ncbi:hypothetical protein NBM05_02200 [Rothia sp. AR01]|uniref:SAF domain-containing protein n=1 Tax=Rothia santali TaxID=2949643 RepID=A0A9X2KHG0_9MICC|nr:SAF domain-containing protein [Rothia santali]MCP3424870.1 hypothetical protein [Rothia santali]